VRSKLLPAAVLVLLCRRAAIHTVSVGDWLIAVAAGQTPDPVPKATSDGKDTPCGTKGRGSMNRRHRLGGFTIAIASVPFGAARSRLRSIAMATAVVAVASPLAVSFVSGPAQAATSCTGVQLQPGANLQNTLDSNGTNTTLRLADGRYTTP